MKLNKYLLLSAFMGLATFTSCSDDDGICEPLMLTFSVSNLGSTSASVGSDGVGLWISSTSLTSLKDADVAMNQKFIPNGSNLTAEGVNWTGQEELYTYAYYPYASAASNNPEAYAVTATANSNLMWAKAETSFNGQNTTPKLAFTHMMSKVVLHVKSDAKEAGALVGGTLTLNNFKTQATANLLNGQVMANGEVADVATIAAAADADCEGVYEAIVVPQTLDAATEFLTMVTTGNVAIKASLDESLSLNSGEEVVLDVLLKEEECVVKVKEIKAWETETEALVAELPSYNVLDLYDNKKGVQGIVVSLDEGSEGKHGWIVSLDEAELEMKKSTFSIYAGDWLTAANASSFSTKQYWERVLEKDATLENFPALEWVDNKNAGRLTLEALAEGDDLISWRWTLPSFADAHYKAFFDLVYDPTNANYEANVEKFNANIDAATAESKNKIPVLDWTGYPASDDLFYWSGSIRNTSSVWGMKMTPGNYSDMLYYYQSASKSDALGQQRNGIATVNKVRAFYHF